MEFVLIYGDDWFSAPLSVQTGNLIRIDEMCVKSVFGEELTIEPARKKAKRTIKVAGGDPDDPLLRWELFTLSPYAYLSRVGIESSNGEVADVLLVPSVAGFREESSPLAGLYPS
jgi:hypothetical protein